MSRLTKDVRERLRRWEERYDPRMLPGFWEKRKELLRRVKKDGRARVLYRAGKRLVIAFESSAPNQSRPSYDADKHGSGFFFGIPPGSVYRKGGRRG